jgi:hypothetical protein
VPIQSKAHKFVLGSEKRKGFTMRYWLILLFLLCLFSPIAAQNSLPLFILIDGDIYSYTGGEPFRETNWGYNHEPVISPDGRYIAYGSLPELLVELDAAGSYPINYDQHPPTNIWIMEIATHEFTRIAEQPQQVEGEEFPRFNRRSNPVWSPDSQRLAWLETNFNDEVDGLELKIYELVSGETQYGIQGLQGVGGDGGFWYMPNTLYWGHALAYDAWVWELPEPYSDYDSGRVLIALDETAILQQRVLENPFNINDRSFRTWAWLEYQGEYYIGLQYDYGWRVWDTRNNSLFIPENTPYRETINGRRVDISPSETAWRVQLANGAVIDLPSLTRSYAFSPDGNALAYIIRNEEFEGRLYLWENGESRELWPESFNVWQAGLEWSPLFWRLEGEMSLIAEPTPFPTPE